MIPLPSITNKSAQARYANILYKNMEKRQLLVIILGLCVIFSLYSIYSLLLHPSYHLEQSSVLRLKFLIAAHLLLLIALTLIFLADQYHKNAIILFVYFLIVAISFFYCEGKVKALPNHKEDVDLLAFNQKKSQKQHEKTFLSGYYLIYMYSFLGTLVLGIFLLVRHAVICYYQNKLNRKLQTAITLVPYSDTLNDKECTICITDFMDNKGSSFYQINNCQHVFHADCIKEWVNYSKTCPLCRTNIFPDRRSTDSLP